MKFENRDILLQYVRTGRKHTARLKEPYVDYPYASQNALIGEVPYSAMAIHYASKDSDLIALVHRYEGCLVKRVEL